MVAVTPPSYGQGLYGVVTMYDVVYDLFCRDERFGVQPPAKPSFWLLAFGAASSSMLGYGMGFWLPSLMKRSFDMELIGIPHRVIVSERGIAAGTFEYRHRRASEAENLDRAALLARLGAA